MSPAAARCPLVPTAAPRERPHSLHHFAIEQATWRAAAPQMLSGRPVPAVLLLKEPDRLLGTANRCFAHNRSLLRICPQAPFAFQAVPASRYARLEGQGTCERSLASDGQRLVQALTHSGESLQERLMQALTDSDESLHESYDLTEGALHPPPISPENYRKLVRIGRCCTLGWVAGVPRHELVRLAASAARLGADLVVWPGHGGLRAMVMLDAGDASCSASSKASSASASP